MQNKFILNLVAANILWSLVPIVVVGILNEFSIFTILLLRFLISGVTLFCFSLFFVLYNNYITKNDKLSFKLIFGLLKKRNKRFYNLRNIYYYSFLGFFGVVLTIVFYFLSLKTSNIAFTVIGYLLSMIFIAFYEQGVASEKSDVFKALYLTLLIFTIGTVFLISAQSALSQGIDNLIKSIIYIFLFTLALTFFTIFINRDSYSKEELIVINTNAIYKIPRLFLKMAICFLLGVGLMFPFILIVGFIPIHSDLSVEVHNFLQEISELNQIAFRWEILFLIVFSTILPYVLIFTAQVFWNSPNLTYSQWAGIIKLIDPLSSLLIAVFFLNEFFPIPFLIIVIFLIAVAIVLRYAHETKNLVQAFLLISSDKGCVSTLPLKLLRFYGIMSVEYITGTRDFVIYVRISSVKDFNVLINQKLRSLPQIKKVDMLFVNKIYKSN